MEETRLLFLGLWGGTQIEGKCKTEEHVQQLGICWRVSRQGPFSEYSSMHRLFVIDEHSSGLWQTLKSEPLESGPRYHYSPATSKSRFTVHSKNHADKSNITVLITRHKQVLINWHVVACYGIECRIHSP